jgi:hypothetical protein
MEQRVIELKADEYEPMGDIGTTTKIRKDRLGDENKPKIVDRKWYSSALGLPEEWGVWERGYWTTAKWI